MKRNLLWIWGGRIINGIGTTSQPVAQASVADMSTGKNKSYRLSLIALAMTLAIIFGPLVGGYLTKNYNNNYNNITIPYWLGLCFSIAVLLFSAIAFKETKHHKICSEMGNIYEFTSIKKLAKSYNLYTLFIIFFCLEFGWSGYYQSIFFYLTHVFGYTPQQISIFNAYIGIIMAGSLAVMYPYLIRNFSLDEILKGSLYTLLFAFVMSVIFPYPKLHWVFATLIASCTGIAYTSLIASISNKLPTHRQGKAMGYASTLLFLAWTITAFIGGPLFHLYKLLPLCTSVVALGVATYFRERYLQHS
jgi:DHA1 family tetracycline resistance protein-like MFS transporter